ncbi:MAG TPA: hypothetical protein VL361_29030 [Candidatus Limnocylindrales bacterium]|nr:hypothetical protein [Candidatus Limnocylindrales bacterium]
MLYGIQPGTTITAQVRVWNGAEFGSWQEASGTEAGWTGASPLFQVTPTALPLPPAFMIGLQPFKAGLFLDCIFPPPGPTPLRINVDQNNLSLTWPARVCDRYMVLQKPNLGAGNWTSLPDSRVLVGRTNEIEFQMQVPIPTNNMFFHLRWQ